VPQFRFGVPLLRVTESDVAPYGETFKGIAIDPDDPPTFESEAGYLQRHGLLLPGEKHLLKRSDFEPERVAFTPRPDQAGGGPTSRPISSRRLLSVRASDTAVSRQR
jgi:hypothetical protein